MNLFVITLEYRADLSIIDHYLEEHRTFLNTYYEQEIFLISGPQVPRTGGVIIAKCADKKTLEMLLKKDPFYQHKLANYQIIEFEAKKHATCFNNCLS